MQTQPAAESGSLSCRTLPPAASSARFAFGFSLVARAEGNGAAAKTGPRPPGSPAMRFTGSRGHSAAGAPLPPGTNPRLADRRVVHVDACALCLSS
ncbi:hypothetical protein MRX96_011357 [Rhipicephalus microplus]